MRSAKPILVIVLTVVLGAYAFDCGAMTTPEQAMECCKSMPCTSQGHHGQDCCKSMPTAHAPFVQPSSMQVTSMQVASGPHAVFAAIAAPRESYGVDFSSLSVAAHCHAPPVSALQIPLSLRI